MRTTSALTLLILGAVGCLALVNPPLKTPAALVVNGETMSDVSAFKAIAEKVRAGDSYYPTMGFELRKRNYPTLSVFNWRSPLHLRAVAAAPAVVWRAVLTALLVALCASTMATVRQPAAAMWVARGMQVGVLVIESAWQAIYQSEAWAGVLIGLSICAYALRRHGWAVACGLLALFVRELAAPYCIVCTVIALLNRRWREASAWLVGSCLYASYFAWHVSQVAAQRLPTDFAHDQSWIQFGGLPFLQATVMKLGWLVLLPESLAALAVVLIVGGIVNPRAPLHLRAASGAYAMFFLVAGLPFNGYWGWMAVPAWAMVCGYGVDTVSRALVGILGPPAEPHAPPSSPA